MAFRVVRFDDTEYFREDLQKKCGRIYEVYVYDDSAITCCCEVTPSYELNYVGVTWRDYPDDNDEYHSLRNDLVSPDRDVVRYIHCRLLDKKPDDINGRGKILNNIDNLEDAVEYVNGNGYID